MRAIFIGILSVWLLAGCDDAEEQKAIEEMVIQRELDRRIANYKTVLFENCQERAIEEATRIADSIMIEEARLLKDTMGKPAKPPRPERPELRKLEDSTPVRPFLRDSLGG
jgi:hypothetical protein